MKRDKLFSSKLLQIHFLLNYEWYNKKKRNFSNVMWLTFKKKVLEKN